MGAQTASEPKVGLALSGGGFRAAFFHVGVLARLAELGILRQVEVISTVSGGSIAGALYYLRLKRLLEQEPDGNLDDPDYEALDQRYCELVKDVEERLRNGVGKNLRARVASNLFKDLYMTSPRYSRSDRMGDLYDRYLYKQAWEEGRPPEEERPRKWWGYGPETQIALRELRINPLDRSGQVQEAFHPGTGNVDRANKVPSLLINASALNSGHNWRFEAIRMGESESGPVAAEVDKNMRLKRAYFDPEYPDDAGDQFVVPEKQRDFPLALAVAASAAVPGIFNPLAIGDVYEGIRVELVDGGVQDNQGLWGLLDEGCTHLIVSDASHQMGDERNPAATLPAVAARSSSIAGDRIRDLQILEISTGTTPHALMDLRKGLKAPVIAPIGAAMPADDDADGDEMLDYEVSRPVQAALADVRTDLDFFSKVEVSSLELDGYLMTKHVLKAQAMPFMPVSTPKQHRITERTWRFQEQVGALFTVVPAPAELMAHLEAAKSKFLRPLKIPGALTVTLICFAVAVVLAVLLALLPIGGWIDDVLPASWPDWLQVAAVALAILTLGTYIGSGSRSLGVRKACSLVSGFLLPLILTLPAWIWSVVQLMGKPLRMIGDRIPAPPPAD